MRLILKRGNFILRDTYLQTDLLFVFFSRYDYFNKDRRVREPRRYKSKNFDVCFVPNPISYRKNDWRRLANAVTYAIFVLFIGLFKRPRPKWIYVAVPSHFAAFSSYVLARFFHAKLIFEVFDIWSLTFVHLHGFSLKSPIVRSLIAFDRLLVKKSDLVVSPLSRFDAYCRDYLHIEIDNKFLFLYQGYEEESGEINIANQFLDKFANSGALAWVVNQKKQGRRIFVYAGTMGSSNNIYGLCESLSRLGISNTNTAFLFIGRGDLAGEIRALLQKGLSERCAVFPPVGYSELIAILSKCDFAVNSHPDIRLYDYGLASLKSLDYIKAGIPIAYLGREPLIEALGVGFCSSSIDEFIKLAEIALRDSIVYSEYKKANLINRNSLTWNSLVAKLEMRMVKLSVVSKIII